MVSYFVSVPYRMLQHATIVFVFESSINVRKFSFWEEIGMIPPNEKEAFSTFG